MDNLSRKFFAEVLGTFTLASMVLISLTASFPIATPIAAAITLCICVYWLGDISGCHLNPAITFAVWIAKKISMQDAMAYMVAQVTGGFLALIMFSFYIPEAQQQWLTTQSAGCWMGELVGAEFFAFGVVATALNHMNKTMVGIVVGGSLLIGGSMSHLLSYGVLNPAIALATKAWSWQYLVMPFVGAAVGSFICKMLFVKANPASAPNYVGDLEVSQ